MNPPKLLCSTIALTLIVWLTIACGREKVVPAGQILTTALPAPSSPTALLISVTPRAGSIDSQQFVSPSDIEALLPDDGASVDIMQLVSPLRLLELTKKFGQGVAQNLQWWISALKKAAPGEPVPYDPRLGLTRDEYDEFLALSKKVTLSKVKSTFLRISRDGDRFTFDGGVDLPDLTGVELDLTSNSVRTPFGVAAQRSEIKASEGQTWTGPWNAVQWKFEKFGPQLGMGTTIAFALGRLIKTGRGILYYDVSETTEKSARSLLDVLYYDLKTSP